MFFSFGGIVWRFSCIVRSPSFIGYPLVFLALRMIVVIALLHTDNVSSMLGGSASCRIFVASGMGVVSGRGEGSSVCCWSLACCCRWAEFRSLTRRLICLVSDLAIGGRSVLVSMGGVCLVVGHIVCSCLWYVCI